MGAISKIAVPILAPNPPYPQTLEASITSSWELLWAARDPRALAASTDAGEEKQDVQECRGSGGAIGH